MLENLRKINLAYLKLYQTVEDPQMIQKYLLIQNILNDDACFFKISKEQAMFILSSLSMTDKESMYEQLISEKEYQRLVEKGLL